MAAPVLENWKDPVPFHTASHSGLPVNVYKRHKTVQFCLVLYTQREEGRGASH